MRKLYKNELYGISILLIGVNFFIVDQWRDVDAAHITWITVSTSLWYLAGLALGLVSGAKAHPYWHKN